MNRRNIMTVLAAMLLLLTGLMGMAAAETLPEDGEFWLVTEEELAQMEALKTMTREVEIEIIPEEDPGMAIETPFITLYYPTDYAERTTVSVESGSNSCTITVRATVDGKKLKLFSLTLSKSASEGYKLGKLGSTGVYVLMNEQRAADWSEAGFQTINELQESVNTLLMQIYECENFAAGS